MSSSTGARCATEFPIFLRLAGRRVVVVGGGMVALRKIQRLLRSGACVEVVAQRLHPGVAALVAGGEARHVGRAFDPEQLVGCRYVVAATTEPALNAAVAAAAEACGAFVNVVDDAALSTAISPAIIDRSPVTVAVSSGGTAPVLARRLRARIEAQLPSNLGALARFIGAARQRIKARIPPAARRGLWERFVDGPGAEAVMNGDEVGAARTLAALAHGTQAGGEVYLVGAGPGDPDLLTLRALRLMQQADVVLYDRLLDPRILEQVRRDAERVFVGKRSRHPAVPQARINVELVRRARAGQRVLRLKGGDPFVFGRGGEEMQELVAHGIPFQVVPGISAANGCAAYAGIPLTHRDYAQACVFVTGHARDDGELQLPWEALAQARQTVVIYMGLATLPMLCERLIAAGLPPDWPAALIENGTRRNQQVITATLADLPIHVATARVSGTSLVIVGEVVKLRDRLEWFHGSAVVQNTASPALDPCAWPSTSRSPASPSVSSCG